MTVRIHRDRGQPVHDTGRWMFLAGIASSSWTEIGAAGIVLGDLLFFGGGILLLLTRRSVSPISSSTGTVVRTLLLSGWLIVLSAAIVAVRYGDFADLGVAVRVGLVLVASPVFMLAFVRIRRDAVQALGALFISAAVNSGFAISDLAFGVHISPAQFSWSAYEPLLLTRGVGLTGHPNILGYLTAVTLPLAAVMFAAVRTRRGRWGVLAGALLIGAGLFLSGSRGAAFGAGCGMLFVAGRSRRPRVRAGVLGITVAFLFAAWLLRDAALISRLLGDATAAASDQGRRTDLSEGWRLVVEGLPTGVGFSEISAIHSGVLAILASGGVLGILGFMTWGAQVWRAVRRAARSPQTTIRNIAIGCGGATIGMAAFLLVSPIIFHRYAVVPASVVIALIRLERDGSDAGTRETNHVGHGPSAPALEPAH